MNVLCKAVLGVALMTGPGAVSALGQGLEVSLGGGPSLPVGDFGSASNIGWHGLAGLSFAPGALGIRVDGAYHRFGFDDQGGPDLDIYTEVMHATASLFYRFKASQDARLRPYLLGGVGYYKSEVKGDDDPGDTADPGVNFGAGLDLKVGALGAFVEGRFHNIFFTGTGTNRVFIPITVGVRLGGN